MSSTKQTINTRNQRNKETLEKEQSNKRATQQEAEDMRKERK